MAGMTKWNDHTEPTKSNVNFFYTKNIYLFQEDGNTILQLSHDLMPDMLADILLFSRLRNFSPDIGLALLKTVLKSRKRTDKISRLVFANITIN